MDIVLIHINFQCQNKYRRMKTLEETSLTVKIIYCVKSYYNTLYILSYLYYIKYYIKGDTDLYVNKLLQWHTNFNGRYLYLVKLSQHPLTFNNLLIVIGPHRVIFPFKIPFCVSGHPSCILLTLQNNTHSHTEPADYFHMKSTDTQQTNLSRTVTSKAGAGVGIFIIFLRFQIYHRSQGHTRFPHGFPFWLKHKACHHTTLWTLEILCTVCDHV